MWPGKRMICFEMLTTFTYYIKLFDLKKFIFQFVFPAMSSLKTKAEVSFISHVIFGMIISVIHFLVPPRYLHRISPCLLVQPRHHNLTNAYTNIQTYNNYHSAFHIIYMTLYLIHTHLVNIYYNTY